MIHILLADDDTDDCLLFKEALNEVQIKNTLTCVHNGEDLIDILSKASEKKFQIIFLDLNMPLKNGLECLQEIKRNLKFEFLPIVIFSTSYDKKISEMLYKNGAQYYICKPSSFTCLKNVIEFVLSLIASDINNKVKTTQPEKEKFYIELK